jgi:hypothetical protein
MATAMVVATIVNTTMSEAGFRQHMVEQLRVNNRSLLDKLADADDDADVVTAVLNVDEFLAYLIRRFPTTVDTAFANDSSLESAPATKEIEGSVDLKAMSEGEFMDFMLTQIESGKVEPLVKFSEHEWDNGIDDDMDDEGDIGEDISHYPFFY